MATFKEIVLRMVGRQELSARQALALIEQVRESTAPVPVPPTAPPASQQPIAIIGMSGRFPGANDIDAYWQNLRNGVNSVGDIPRTRWSFDDIYDPDPKAAGKSYCKSGGFIDGVDEFDAAFFHISAKEAQLIDPQQRLFLEEASRALEHAGLTAEQLDGMRCCVFAGVAGSDFIHQITNEGITPDAYAFMGNASSILAARISYHLNLKGPSIAVDTACSSSLVAIHLACESLALGTSELALVGGVCVLSTPNFFLAGSKAGMLSRRGACSTFDQDADGFVPAEGVGVIVLKPLDRALADGDNILGVIKGSAINQDGRTNGITAPSAPSQTALALEVYEKFGIDPATIGYVEAHGTGTPLGDPIEIEALSAAFRKYTSASGFCAIGSSKTNIGHAMSASGMAGVIKILKALEAGELPPSLHFKRENAAIGFASTPFRVNTSLESWLPPSRGGARHAAVSGFGFSGTNAHLVIAQAPQAAVTLAGHEMRSFPVSAKTRVALQSNCNALADWLELTPGAPLDSVSWTLLTGRNHYEHRVVLQASTTAALVGLLRGTITDTTAEIPSADELFGTRRPMRIGLPTYRFERHSHALGTATKPKLTTAPHPLLDHAGTDCFQSLWDASLPFVRDHQVLGEHIVPGACLIELAFATTHATALEQVVFHSPLRVGLSAASVELRLEEGSAFLIRNGSRTVASGRILSTTQKPVISTSTFTSVATENASAIDIDIWLARADTDVEALNCRFDSAGVVLGPYCRGLQRLWLKDSEAFAQLRLPVGEARSLAYYTLHPTLVDGGFQAAMALLAQRSSAVLVPASIGKIQVHASLPATCYAHVRLTSERSFDLEFVDAMGALLASCKNFTVAQLNQPARTPQLAEPVLRFYRPDWVDAPAQRTPVVVPGLTLVVRAPDVVLNFAPPDHTMEVILGEHSLSIAPGQWQVDATSSTAFADLMADLKPLGRVIFLGGQVDSERDLVGLLHLLQALPQTGVHVVVCAPPDSGAVLGFAQAVSREESPLRLSIIESADPEAAWCEAPAEEAGVMLAVRSGQRVRRMLAEHILAGQVQSRLRRGGVYLIAGGAGGIGLALAKHLVAQHDACVVLLGRRKLVLDLPAAISYRQVDITDSMAVAAVVAETIARHGIIHGVVHAAMVLRDGRMRNMDAATLRAVLAPKLAGSAVLARQFAGQALDFMAFFSSANSFFGNAGQSNYAAASMGQDAIARHMRAHAGFPVHVINWGFWGEVGAVATPVHRQRALEHGIGAISVAEGLQAFEACLSSSCLDLMPMKVAPAMLARMGLLAAKAGDVMDSKMNGHTDGDSDDEIAAAFAAVENHGRAALRQFIGVDGHLTLKVAPKYTRLRDALEAIAAQPVRPLSQPIADWTAPFVVLIDQCIAHYPAVLAGDQNAAEVLFPGGATHLVAPLYRNNPIVDRYNVRTAQELVTCVKEILRYRDRVRIFEIGAGTGGTSRGVLAALAGDASRVDFVFTDLSSGLVRQAKNELGPQYPFAQFRTFDAGAAPASQGILEQDYDVVLASNVLHATRNIAVCLQHVHSLLRDGGVLLLNESIRLYDFSTLTFGLTEGWWLFDDVEARLPHSPLLDERRWRQALVECFDKVDLAADEMDAPQAVFIATARSRTTVRTNVMPAEINKPLYLGTATNGAADTAPLQRTIHRHLAAVLGVGVADVDPERRFSELGVDSITGADLVRRINESLHTTLLVTVLYDHSSVWHLARYVATLAATAPTPEAMIRATPEPAKTHAVPDTDSSSEVAPQHRADQPIAIVGLAGRFPGASNTTEFWRDLQGGVCRTGEVPSERWDVHGYYDPDPAKPGKSPSKWGGFLDNIDKFDPAFFQMSGTEAEYTDPQQRLFIQEAWHALEDAGYSPAWLDGKRCGVFVGATAGDYIHRMDPQDLKPQVFLGNGISMLASRISYLLNLHGTAMSVDTACSSSLLAVHLACQSIHSGECDLALAGGVFVNTTSSFHALTGRLGMLSSSDRCRAFDESADGFVSGEAVGAVVLRPLDAAIRDGDFIYGVIAGSGTNHDGHTNGLTAPSATSQAELEARVYQHAGIDPRTISYVEAHGTGTRLGDPIEIEGLTRSFRQFTPDRQFCAIGSVKTNVGHAGPAAGIVSLIKVLLAMHHREIPPSLNFNRANGAIDFVNSPFYVATDCQPWLATPMRAAVSAFGLSGTNVHLVVEEPPETTRAVRAAESGLPPLFAVSAMSESALRERVAELEAWLDSEGHQHSPHDIAYTLCACRKHHVHRAVVRGPVNHPLAARYLAGESVDWLAIYSPETHRRVPLPGYPFSRERYWVNGVDGVTGVSDVNRSDVKPSQTVHTYARTWVDEAGLPASVPNSVALIGGTEAQMAHLHKLLGVPVTRDPANAAAVAFMPGCHNALEPYLEIARQCGQAKRVLVLHRFAEHEAVASAALHHSLRFVHPQMIWQTLGTSADPVVAIARELHTTVDAAELRHTNGVRAAHRLLPLVLPRAIAPLRRSGVWWISGGAGRIGLQLARWLVALFDARVIITSRHAPREAPGRNIEFMGADVSDRVAMQRVRQRIDAQYGTLHGVVHAAGCIDASLLTAKSESRDVLAAKVDGALILDELTRDTSLDAFVLFSSLSALVGDFGQCDYACANRYLESFAEWRALRRPGRTVAIHWPLWAEGGMRLSKEDELRYTEQSGYELLRSETALCVLGQALAASESVVVVACGDAARIDAAFAPRHAPPPSEVAQETTGSLEQIVLQCTARVVRLPAEKLTPASRFSEVGLDSLFMKDLAVALASELGIAISPTAFFQHQTVAALAAHLAPAWRARPAVISVTAVTAPIPTTPVKDDIPLALEPIAIVGISGCFPQSADTAALWEHLAAGDDCVTEIPAERWDWRAYQASTGQEHDKSVSRWGGFMPNISHFDCAFFGMSPREAVFMDPQHRMFLQHVWSAFEDAGIRPSTLAGRPVGVWAGAQPNEYMRLIGDAGEARAQAALGNTQTMLANRVSYWFDFRGPSQTVDTACSSSLISVHRAVQSLQHGECEFAVAGGVSAILLPETYVLASQLGMLSEDGRCKTFDSLANGYVKGEGVGVLLLKTLSKAQADGDRIYGVIRATAEGHGGKASSLTAPNPQAQAQLVFDTWKRAGVPINSVSYVEAHGTGTELGDPLEVEALTTAFRALAREQGVALQDGSCALGSIKSNIGHLEPAAGVAGMIKVLLAMQHEALPATLHVKQVNPYLKLEGSPFRLVQERSVWTGMPLRAGVSAFGFGGSNAHVALEAASSRFSDNENDNMDFVANVPLSAKTSGALVNMVRRLCEHLERQPVRWCDVVFTLQQGREAFDHRITVSASSTSDLINQCRGWLTGSTLAAVRQVMPLQTGRRVALPTYPFERKHLWFDHPGQATAVVRPPVVKASSPPAPPSTPLPPVIEAMVAVPASLELIRGILADLLYLEPASITDDTRFVDLGLDSILAVEFAKKLQDRFAMDVRASRLYDHSSVFELAAYVDAGLVQTSPAAMVPESSVAVVAVMPSSVASRTLDEVRAMLAELLYLQVSDITDDAPFVELGLDSILAVEFAKKLQDRYAIDLRATRLYDYSRLCELAQWIDSMIEPAISLAPVPVPVPVPAVELSAEVRDGDIAIIGMAGRFPGANDVQAFWRNLAAGVDSVGKVPSERWCVNEQDRNQPYCSQGGFIKGVDQFDPLFFKISPQEAEWMDPQQRLFLEQAWLALEDAGQPDRLLSGMRCAVFAGAGQGDYFRLMAPDSEVGAKFGIGNVSSILAARLSYFLNLKGPAVSLDTACSSSLVATHLAAQALINGEVDLAVAGGVSLMVTPQMHLLTCQARMLSPEGRCKTFDTDANGFVPGEGVGAVVLKRLRDALADGDRIHAVIRGSGVNQDGRTNGITAPSAQSQTALALSVYQRHGIDPSTITCVEAHGTGTQLGDPIEIDALTDAFRHYTSEKQYCAIGSVKTNIGHTLAAAGITGLIKSILMLQARKIAPSLHCTTLNEKIDFAESPFYVNQVLRDWLAPSGIPRRVAVSSFGFSGTNAHLVLEEWSRSPAAPVDANVNTENEPWSFILSARTAESLRQWTADLADWLETEGRNVPLGDIAFTLAERRSRHAHQHVVNADHRASLIDKLRATVIANANDPLLAIPHGRVVSLPPYPFDKRRFWVPVEAKHPLIDSFERSFFEATVRKHLDFQHELLVDHVIAGIPTLPGAAYVEIALTCAAELAPKGTRSPMLRKLVWIRPLQLPEKMLTMRFFPDGDNIRFDSPYCQGSIVFAETLKPARIDLQLAPAETFSKEDVYAAFSNLGLAYGDALRGIASLRRNAVRVITQLDLPVDFERYTLDPRVLDAALQTPIGFALGRTGTTAMVPYMLDSVVQHAPLVRDCLAVATLVKGETPCFDILIVNALGDVLVELRGFSSLAPRPKVQADEKSFFTPRWNLVPAPLTNPGRRQHVLVLHALSSHSDFNQQLAGVSSVLLGQEWRLASGEKLIPADIDHRSLADWSRLVGVLADLDKVIFLGGLSDQPLLDALALDEFQEIATLSVVRFVRAWAHAGRALPEVLIVTNGVFRVLDHDLILPQAASLVGLAGVIGKEFRGTRVMHLDIERQTRLSVSELLALASQPAQGSFAYRDKQYFEQRLDALDLPMRARTVATFRAGGVYMIVGGSGGIASALALHLASHHQARIALIGRREADTSIAATLAVISAAGGEAIYLRADIGVLGEMQAALEATLARWGAVHGVIHSALALEDKTLVRLSDADFCATLRAKGRGTCVLAQAFRDVSLDWMLVFSSTNSFTRNAGQASYAAASTLQDATAAALARDARWPVRTINWGYWGEVGVVATDRHRAIARGHGVGSITLADAVDAIDRIIASDHQQVAVIRLLDSSHAAPPQTTVVSGTVKNAHSISDPSEPAGPDLEAVRAVVAKVLRTLDEELENDAAFEVYGVDSLVAIDILHKLEPRYGVLPATLLHAHNTISRLASHLAQRETQVRAHTEPQPEPALITINDTGNGPRTFWVHSVLGETDWVSRLGKHLPASWPLHALHLPVSSLKEKPFGTLEAMAASYLAEVRSVQPHGPYILGGYSFGGSVAFEMGRQLLQAEEQVQALILLDAFAPGSAALTSLHDASWDGFLTNVVGALLKRTRDVRPSERELDALTQPLLAAAHQCAVLLDNYAPQPCPMNAILLRNRHSFVGPDSPLELPAIKINDDQPDHGWTPWLGAPPHIVSMDSDHFCLGLEPVIGEVAQQVMAFLEPDTDAVFARVRDHVLRILPGLDAEKITMRANLRALGANSLDRVEVAICTMEDLQLSIAPTEMAGVQDIAGLVDVLIRHLRANVNASANSSLTGARV